MGLRMSLLGAPSGSGLARPDRFTGLADELGLHDVVRFRAPAPRAVVADYYRAADITVVPSYSESFGLVALESQACGTPVAAAAVGGLPTAVAADVSGVLVHGHDPQEWSERLVGLLRTPTLLRSLADGARPHAERFSWDRTAAELITAYEQAAAEHRGHLSLAVGGMQ